MSEQAQKPCEHCGHCPTCGRSNPQPAHYAYPCWYWSTPIYHQYPPWWTYTSNPTMCGSGSAASTSGALFGGGTLEARGGVSCFNSISSSLGSGLTASIN